jgi:hypothetical protein
MAFDRTEKNLDVIVEKHRYFGRLSKHHKINSSKEESDSLTLQAQKNP